MGITQAVLIQAVTLTGWSPDVTLVRSNQLPEKCGDPVVEESLNGTHSFRGIKE